VLVVAHRYNLPRNLRDTYHPGAESYHNGMSIMFHSQAVKLHLKYPKTGSSLLFCHTVSLH
jgi:hypothetical protein